MYITRLLRYFIYINIVILFQDVPDYTPFVSEQATVEEPEDPVCEQEMEVSIVITLTDCGNESPGFDSHSTQMFVCVYHHLWSDIQGGFLVTVQYVYI